MTPSKKHGLLLTIDDEKMIREVISSLAEAAGFDCIMAGTPNEIALALDQKPDVIILDMSMPDMDGFEVIWELQRRKSKASLIISTGCASVIGTAAETIAAKSELKRVLRLDKPFDSSKMLLLLGDLLRELNPPNSEHLSGQ